MSTMLSIKADLFGNTFEAQGDSSLVCEQYEKFLGALKLGRDRLSQQEVEPTRTGATE